MALPMKKQAMKSKGTASVKSTTMKKAMKAKKVSKVATGKLAKVMVLRGSKERTTGGLKRGDVIKNKRGRAVSKRASAVAKKRYSGSRLEAWIKACSAARKALGIVGLCPINGKTAQGKALYAKAKAIYSAA